MKRQNQINKTKNAIREAMLELLEGQAYDNISITDLTKKAEVSRMSFYRHFEDKDAVVKYIFEGIITEVEKNIDDKSDCSHMILSMIEVLSENYEIYALFENEDTNKIFTEFKNTDKVISEAVNRTSLGNVEKEFVKGGINAVILNWLKYGMDESVKDLHKKLMKMIKSI